MQETVAFLRASVLFCENSPSKLFYGKRQAILQDDPCDMSGCMMVSFYFVRQGVPWHRQGKQSFHICGVRKSCSMYLPFCVVLHRICWAGFLRTNFFLQYYDICSITNITTYQKGESV